MELIHILPILLKFQNDGSSETKMSDFSISTVGSVSGYQYLWEQTTETYTIGVSNNGSLFN